MSKKRLSAIFSGRNIYCIVSIAVLATLVVLGSIFLGPKLISTARDPEQFREFLGADGIKSALIFIGIQMLQIFFAFIPGEFIEVGAGYVFGGIKGLILCLIGSFISTVIIFGLTRLLGRKFTGIMIDSRDLKKLKFLKDKKKVKLLLSLLYFIPGTPKDLITYFAGLTSIKWGEFLIISTFLKIPSILSSTLAGAALLEKQYLQSFIIFSVTGVAALIGYYIYYKLSNKKKKSS